MAGATVLILGGGVGGVVTARRLRQRLGSDDRVVVVDKEDKHLFAPSLPWVMNGWRRPENACRQLSVLGEKGIEFVQGAVTSIDVENRRVSTENDQIDWDYLVIALGAEMTYEGVPGLEQASQTFYTLDGAVDLRTTLEEMEGGKVLVTVAGMPFRCPAAPYEGALLIDHLLRKRGVRDRASIKFTTPEPQPLLVAGPSIGSAVQDIMSQRDVAYYPSRALAEVRADDKVAVFADGSEEDFDLLVTIPRHRAPSVLGESGLVGDSGWIEVDRGSMATEYPGVWALGDATFIGLSSGLPLPKAGVFAHAQAHIVAENVASQIQHGKEGDARFDGHGSCFLEIGYRKAAMATGNFYGEPNPQVKMRNPGFIWHWGKVLLEWQWFFRWF